MSKRLSIYERLGRRDAALCRAVRQLAEEVANCYGPGTRVVVRHDTGRFRAVVEYVHLAQNDAGYVTVRNTKSGKTSKRNWCCLSLDGGCEEANDE